MPLKEGWPEFPVTVEGWIEREGAVLHVEGVPPEENATPLFAAALLGRLRPEPWQRENPGACFNGGYLTGPANLEEATYIVLKQNVASVDAEVTLTVDLSVMLNRSGVFDPARFGDLTRRLDIAGVPGGERVAIWKGEVSRTSGFEFLVTAGGQVDDHGIQARATMNRQHQFPDTPPLTAREALVIWHSVLRFIARVGF
ncbi:hypothetical protein [uncultured Tateyamaria sp.]|uniref:hypothetical protein n=1 Tax=uncultured Tateyamaria sp. TaxID=455651 RepID=UPI00260E497D|nr:hypothetical protein [uncultured Tateyamaria sp.]